MEFLFTASYQGMEARLVFQSFGLCMQARKVLRSKGCTCSDVTPQMGKLDRSAAELEAATRFVAFALS
jgi:hypothetical protein